MSRQPKTERTQHPPETLAEIAVLWIFQCGNRMALHAATPDFEGQNLPIAPCENSRWVRTGHLLVETGNHVHPGVDLESLKIGITQVGVYLWIAMPVPDGLVRLMR